MSQVNDRAHSAIGASSYHRWGPCPGSVELCKSLPPTTSSHAEEGTNAHTLGQFKFERGRWPFDAEVGFQVTEEMKEAVQVYVDYIEEQLKVDVCEVLIEHKFNLEKLLPGLFGTADCVLYYPKKKLLKVIDYKHGQGVFVPVERNEQLMYYGLGALLSTGFLVDTIELTIVQPRCPSTEGVIRSWSFDSFEILDFAADLKAAALKTREPNAPLVPGEDQCRFCPAKAICPALHKQADEAAALEFRSDLSYSPEQLSDVLKKLPTMKAFIQGVEQFAYQEALHGRTPPGFKLVEKRSTRQWTDETQVLEFMKSTVNLSESEFKTTPELKSVAQIEKLLSKSMKEKLKPFIVSKSSGTTLAEESDPRPEVRTDAASEFDVIDVSALRKEAAGDDIFS